tara:strand:+ start:112 stop:753 length:642 start_codon:yes stop_codon:yes gene_type:complete
MDKIDLQIFRPFGPSILKVKIPKDILDKLNNYIDEIIIDSEKSKNLDYGKNLIGDVTQEFKLEENFAKEVGWVNFLGNCTSHWVKMETDLKMKKFALLDSWVVRQFQHEYNPVHYHNGHVSGAGFLKLPKSFGDHVQKDEKKEKKYTGGTLNLIHGQKSFLCNSIFTIRPEVGDFYFFPHYLMHTVYPFKNTNEERRSISFNAMVDPEIFVKI